ncbi:hypothetical protein AUP68_11293 [Ilyonectria robusta]
MPKRYFDIGPMDATMNADTPPQKTQRSHEQNQERAYIAASRRTDRSIEARVQSARMASDVHKKRTGKAFYVSEVIVLKEEMYEEVEEVFPRSYQFLRPHLQTSSAEMNSRLDAYLKRENEVNSKFAKHFPQFDHSLSRRWSIDSFLTAPSDQSDGLQGPVSNAQRRSLTELSPPELGADVDKLTSPILTSESASHPETPRSRAASVIGNSMHPNSFQGFNSDGSAFAADLPLEAKMLLAGSGHGQSDVIDPALFDQQWMYADAPLNNSYEVSKRVKMDDKKDAHCELCIGSLDPNLSAADLSWNTFIDDAAWENYQQ